MAGERDAITGVVDREVAPAPTKQKKQKEANKSREPTMKTVVMGLGERVEMLEGNMETMKSNMGTLESHMVARLEDLKEADLTLDDNITHLEEVVKTLQESIEGLHAIIKEARDEILVCKRAVANSGAGPSIVALRVEQPKPKSFSGRRDAQEVKDFLWHMEQYFEGTKLTDEGKKVRTASLYLSGVASLWWRRKHAEIEKGTCRVDTWDEFKRELKKHFYPENVVYEARKRLRELSQRASIPDYVREFTTLTLQIPNLTDEEILFNFIAGLQPWVRQELQHRGVTMVDEAIDVAESLTEYQRSSHSHSNGAPKEKSDQPYHVKGGGEKRDDKAAYHGRRDHKPSTSRKEYRDHKPLEAYSRTHLSLEESRDQCIIHV